MKNISNFEDYFHEKLDFGKTLGLNNSVIMQGLTVGLKAEYQNILIVNFPNIATEWFRMASKRVTIPPLLHFLTKCVRVLDLQIIKVMLLDIGQDHQILLFKQSDLDVLHRGLPLCII